MTDQELKDMDDLPEILSSGHDDYDNSLRVAEIIKDLKRHREAVKVYQKYIRTQTEYLDKDGRAAQEVLKRGDEVLKGEE